MKYQYWIVIMSLLIVSYSCGPAATTSEISTEIEDAEEEAEQYDKSQRPSPPRTTTANISGVNVTIDYSSPAVKGRVIFGELEPYGKVWRTGANEATVITTDADISVSGQNLPKGQYALFAIPGENEWTIIFNKEPNQWGAFNYNESEDALRVNVKPTVSENVTERLNFTVSSEGRIAFTWERVSFSLELSVTGS